MNSSVVRGHHHEPDFHTHPSSLWLLAEMQWSAQETDAESIHFPGHQFHARGTNDIGRKGDRHAGDRVVAAESTHPPQTQPGDGAEPVLIEQGAATLISFSSTLSAVMGNPALCLDSLGYIIQVQGF
jgi:hypothetical protein